ncbi:MAG: NAD-dependent epimerase/dehydratase family protein [Sphaerochaetaceae bacterium]|jgi:nucleoside-diphosphate-sugar epimerase
MKVAIIGATGHIGTYLVPRLVEKGHRVVAISRGKNRPYREHRLWKYVEQVVIDRDKAEAEGTFGSQIAALDADVIIDLLCFTTQSAKQLVEQVRNKVEHLLVCGSVWAYGAVGLYPTKESDYPRPICDYGEAKSHIERYLLQQARAEGLPATVIHPGHIVGPGWLPVNPQGNFNAEVWHTIAQGRRLLLPHMGMETVHHVHADDVASVFIAAMENWSASVGESFFALSEQAVSLRYFAQSMFDYFFQEENIEYASWEEFTKRVSQEDAAFSYDHISKSPSGSIDKAKRVLGYHPSYTSLEAVEEAVEFILQADKRLKR